MERQLKRMPETPNSLPIADLIADADSERRLGPRGRLLLGLASAGAFLLAVAVAPYSLAALGHLGWDWATMPVAGLSLLLLALAFVAGRDAFTGRGRASLVVTLLVVADFAILLWFWG